MATNSVRSSAVTSSPGAVTHGTPPLDKTQESWVDLLLADEEWVRREFEDIVAAGWGGAVPPRPAPIQGSHRPRRPRYDDRPTPGLLPEQRHLEDRARPRQRGPPA